MQRSDDGTVSAEEFGNALAEATTKLVEQSVVIAGTEEGAILALRSAANVLEAYIRRFRSPEQIAEFERVQRMCREAFDEAALICDLGSRRTSEGGAS